MKLLIIGMSILSTTPSFAGSCYMQFQHGPSQNGQQIQLSANPQEQNEQSRLSAEAVQPQESGEQCSIYSACMQLHSDIVRNGRSNTKGFMDHVYAFCKSVGIGESPYFDSYR